MNTRQIFAALANPDTRTMYARVILDQLPMAPTSKQSRALENLQRAGLIDDDGGAWSPTGVFRDLLAKGATGTPKGYERFLDKGRVTRWPSKASDKDGLIRWIVDQCLATGERIDERELNDRLEKFSNDPALIRRHGVDTGYITRNRDGSEYRR
ncbi:MULTISPECIES: DUF2087 domain-containing protein [unclassified Candidatus Sulfotelmatobacter]|uniref:DUF2087 domain-containing protein n=1 Tax=unclassified Candidatus Sulfotelmatobacter TaxID=2635724 RepID=UPI0016882FFD|nr:DUF2087 domain-containing protein [Kocuria sp. cx-116]MBD2760959.1 DUF2087 domain-containing protein [Kocuria sp. cx-116]